MLVADGMCGGIQIILVTAGPGFDGGAGGAVPVCGEDAAISWTCERVSCRA